jgi:hypothetical protein
MGWAPGDTEVIDKEIKPALAFTKREMYKLGQSINKISHVEKAPVLRAEYAKIEKAFQEIEFHLGR